MTGKESKKIKISLRLTGKHGGKSETLAFQENRRQSHLQNINQSIKYCLNAYSYYAGS